MPILRKRSRKYKQPKDVEINWGEFKGGLNLLLKPSELKGNELAQADNLMLVGSGVPTKRWGTANYFLAGTATTNNRVRGLFGAYFNSDTNQLLAITDDGYLVRKSNASYAIITGASWASGYNMEMAMLNDYVYLCNGNENLRKYSVTSSGATLATYAKLSTPTGLYATNISGATGLTEYSWRVSAESQVGETLASTAISLASVPQDLTEGSVRIGWTPVSAASGILKGYVIYGREAGDETFLSRVGKDTTTFDDDGSNTPADLATPPTADTTQGPIAKYIVPYKGKFILAGIKGSPTEIMWSGGGADVDRFHWSYGGGRQPIDKDSGDDITGLGIFQDRVIVFKERSIWEVTFTSSGQLQIPVIKLITKSHGCVSHRTIRAVENDLFFLSRKGVYVLGYEPNIMSDVLRTSEISAKIRPYIEGKTPSEFEESTASYTDYKYILSLGSRMVIYDRERMCWMGPWNLKGNAFLTYYDSNNEEKWLMGDREGGYVTEMNAAYKDDKGTAFTTLLRTKQEDFGDWTRFKTIKDVYTRFRNVLGNVGVNIRLEERDGTTITAESYSVTAQMGSSGFGTEIFGNTIFGDSENTAGYGGSQETIKWYSPHKMARTLQVEVTTSSARDAYELLGIKSIARPTGRGFTPASWRV